jgi:hypothetical protein
VAHQGSVALSKREPRTYVEAGSKREEERYFWENSFFGFFHRILFYLSLFLFRYEWPSDACVSKREREHARKGKHTTMAMTRALRGVGDEEPVRELINKERRFQDGFMDRALHPPPLPPSYSNTPAPSRPATSSALDKLVAIGSVPAGDKLERPLSAKSKAGGLYSC